tara:strand:+ start:250 stop:453 length:204 start_codon:yes stop_codon:yes gene_type:complete
MPHVEVKQNKNGDWAIFMKGWDTDVNGDGHVFSECRDMVDMLIEKVQTLATETTNSQYPSLFEADAP